MDIYALTEESYSLVDRYRDSGMPRGLRYLASVTGPWHLLGILEIEEQLRPEDQLRMVPDLLAEAFGEGSTVATSIRSPTFTKRSRYHDHSAFFIVWTEGGADPDAVQGELEEITGGNEVEPVFGSFDFLAYTGVEGDEDLRQRAHRVRDIPGVARSMTLRVMDYVSTSPDAPPGHRPRGTQGGRA